MIKLLYIDNTKRLKQFRIIIHTFQSFDIPIFCIVLCNYNILINLCIQPTCTKQEREDDITYQTTEKFQSESLSETSSIYGYSCKYHQSQISTSADETENNDHIT